MNFHKSSRSHAISYVLHDCFLVNSYCSTDNTIALLKKMSMPFQELIFTILNKDPDQMTDMKLTTYNSFEALGLRKC